MPTTPEMVATTFEQALDNWIHASAEAKRWKEREANLRNALFSAAFPEPVEGVNKRELADGRIFKATHKINRGVDEAQVQAVKEQLRALGDNEVVFEDLFKLSHDLKVGPYKKLADKVKRIVDMAVTSKPGMPEIEVI